MPWFVLGWSMHINQSTSHLNTQIDKSLDEMRQGCNHFLDDNLGTDIEDEAVGI